MAKTSCHNSCFLNSNSSLRNYINHYRGVMVNVLDCDILVSEFELHLLYNTHFRTDTLMKCLKFLIFSLLFFYKDNFCIKQSTKVDGSWKKETKSNQLTTKNIKTVSQVPWHSWCRYSNYLTLRTKACIAKQLFL